MFVRNSWPRRTKKDLSDPDVEKFLLFEDAEFSVTKTTLVSCLHVCVLALYFDILSWAVAKEEVSAEFGCEAKDVQSLLDARQRQRRNQAPRRRRRAKLRRTYPFLSCSVLPVASLFYFLHAGRSWWRCQMVRT